MDCTLSHKGRDHFSNANEDTYKHIEISPLNPDSIEMLQAREKHSIRKHGELVHNIETGVDL